MSEPPQEPAPEGQVGQVARRSSLAGVTIEKEGKRKRMRGWHQYPNSGFGVLGLTLSLLLMGLLLIIIMLELFGKASPYEAGKVLGIPFLGCWVGGLSFSIAGLRQERRSKILPWIGVVISGGFTVLVIVMIILAQFTKDDGSGPL